METHRHRALQWASTYMALMLLAIVVVACGGAPGDASRTPVQHPTATAPSDLSVHLLSLGGFAAAGVVPGAHGAIVYGPAGADEQQGGTTLKYYDFGAQTVQVLAQATPSAKGTARTIDRAQAGGDWVTYSVSIPLLNSTGERGTWELWAVNVVTQARALVARANGGNFVQDGDNVVWSQLDTRPDETSILSLHRYHFASKVSETLVPDLGAGVAFPMATSHGAVFFVKQSIPARATDGMYLLPSAATTPIRLAGASVSSGAMNDQYIVWDDPATFSLTLYSRATAQITQQWASECIRPAIAPDRAYVACVDYQRHRLKLLPLPAGAALQLGAVNIDARGTIANERAYWVHVDGANSTSNQLAYVDLPAA